MIYWRQLRSLLIHKWYVFLAGRLVGVPFWRLIGHDWSKFWPVEFINYARFKYGIKSIDGWAKAWLHHLHHNPHHSEHWILSWRGDPDYYIGLGEPVAEFTVVIAMPETYVREMIADMLATSKEVTGHWDIAMWLNRNGPKMRFHDDTLTRLDLVMKEIGYSLTDNCDWSWIAGRGFREWAGEWNNNALRKERIDD